MQQFNAQFIDRFLQPLLLRIFTDMGEGKQNPYLRKLMAGTEEVPFLPEEKKDFINDYFSPTGQNLSAPRQPKTRNSKTLFLTRSPV